MRRGVDRTDLGMIDYLYSYYDYSAKCNLLMTLIFVHEEYYVLMNKRMNERVKDASSSPNLMATTAFPRPILILTWASKLLGLLGTIKNITSSRLLRYTFGHRRSVDSLKLQDENLWVANYARPAAIVTTIISDTLKELGLPENVGLT